MDKEYDSKWAIGVAKFIVPFVIGFGVVVTSGFLFVPDKTAHYWGLISAYFFPPLGKESVIPSGVALGIHPLIMALSIAFVDIIVALFLVWNYDLAKKIPLVGKFITKVEKIGQSSSDKYGWVKPLRFIGIILFVMVPFQGSGGLVASIVGRLIGMKPWTTFIAISVGAIIGCTLVAYFTDAILGLFETNFFQAILIIVAILIIGIMVFVYKKKNNKTQN